MSCDDKKKVRSEAKHVTISSSSKNARNPVEKTSSSRKKVKDGKHQSNTSGFVQANSSATDPSMRSFITKSNSKTPVKSTNATPTVTPVSSRSNALLASKVSPPTQLLYTRNKEQRPFQSPSAAGTVGRKEKNVSPKRKDQLKSQQSGNPAVSLSSLPRYERSYTDDIPGPSRKVYDTNRSIKNKGSRPETPTPSRSKSPLAKHTSSRIPIPVKRSDQAVPSRSRVGRSTKDGVLARRRSKSPSPSSSRPQSPSRAKAATGSNSTSRPTSPTAPSKSSTPNKLVTSRSTSPNSKRRVKVPVDSDSSKKILRSKDRNRGTTKTGKRHEVNTSGFSAGTSPSKRREKKTPDPSKKRQYSRRPEIPKSYCRVRGQGHDYFHFLDECTDETETVDEDAVRAFLDSNPIFLNSFIDEFVDRTTIMNWIHAKSPHTKSESTETSGGQVDVLDKHKRRSTGNGSITADAAETTMAATTDDESRRESIRKRSLDAEPDATEGTTSSDAYTADAATTGEETDGNTKTTRRKGHHKRRSTGNGSITKDGSETTKTETADDVESRRESIRKRSLDAEPDATEGTTSTDAYTTDAATTGEETDENTKTTSRKVRRKCQGQPYYSACVCNVAIPIFTPPECVPPRLKRKSARRSRHKRQSTESRTEADAEDTDDESTTRTTSAKNTSETSGHSGTTTQSTEGTTTTSSSGTRAKCNCKGALTSQPMMTDVEIESFKQLYGIDLRQVRL